MRSFLLFLCMILCSSVAFAEVVSGQAAMVRNEGYRETRPERGIAGVKIVSDTGAYAITDEDGKYHFPFLPAGQRVLKIDASTLPQIPGVKREGFIPLEITTENPRKVVITPGVMTKVSFGVRPTEEVGIFIPEEGGIPVLGSGVADGDALLRTSVTQDATKLAPHLSASVELVLGESMERDEGATAEKLEFTFNTNYHLFIDRAHLNLWFGETLDGGSPKVVDLPMPLPYKFQVPAPTETIRYQLTVYDKEGKMDRTSVGEWKPLKEA